MTVRYYLDVHVPRAVATGLRLRQIDVITAQQDGGDTLDDDLLLLRATSLNRILVSQDDDLLREGTRFQRDGIPFAGVIYAHQRAVNIGQLVADLTLIAEATEMTEWRGRIGYLPL